MNNTQINEELLRNMGININFKILYILSFLIQWSILSLVLNLITLGFIRLLLYLIFILDAITMIFNKNKTILKPSYLLSLIHDIIGRLSNSNNVSYENNVITNIITKMRNASDNIHKYYQNIRNKFSNIKRSQNKYNKERELNKFNKEIGSKVYVESLSNGEITRKEFKYKDRAISYVNMLKSNDYKDFTIYNLDINTAKAYMVFNKKRDIIDLNNNKIKTSHEDNDYKFIISNWPK